MKRFIEGLDRRQATLLPECLDDLPVTIPMQLGIAAGVCVGGDSGAPTMDAEYKPPYAFTGTVEKALVDVTGEPVEDLKAKMCTYLSRQ